MSNERYFTCAQTGLKRDLWAERAIEENKSKAIKWASETSKEHDIASVCMEHEIESDEFYTAREKAVLILEGGAG